MEGSIHEINGNYGEIKIISRDIREQKKGDMIVTTMVPLKESRNQGSTSIVKENIVIDSKEKGWMIRWRE